MSQPIAVGTPAGRATVPGRPRSQEYTTARATEPRDHGTTVPARGWAAWDRHRCGEPCRAAQVAGRPMPANFHPSIQRPVRFSADGRRTRRVAESRPAAVPRFSFRLTRAGTRRGRRFGPAASAASGACRRSYSPNRCSTRSRSSAKPVRRQRRSSRWCAWRRAGGMRSARPLRQAEGRRTATSGSWRAIPGRAGARGRRSRFTSRHEWAKTVLEHRAR